MTVAELVEALKTADQALPVVIKDADEGTLLNITTILNEPTYVELSGYYDDRFDSYSEG